MLLQLTSKTINEITQNVDLPSTKNQVLTFLHS